MTNFTGNIPSSSIMKGLQRFPGEDKTFLIDIASGLKKKSKSFLPTLIQLSTLSKSPPKSRPCLKSLKALETG